MVAESEPGPTLVLNPADDMEFRTIAESLVAAGIARADALQEGLRRHFPYALVRPRELAGERAQIWYVYRDGHWVRPAC
jgi:hypothetical protein